MNASPTQTPDAGRIAYGFARDKGIALKGGDTPVFLMREGADPLALLEARRAAGFPFTVEVLGRDAYDSALTDIYAYDGLDRDGGDADDDTESLSRIIDEIPRSADLLDAASDAPIIRLINGLIAEAIRTQASDIHVEPFEDKVSVRYRIDGVLSETVTLAPRLAPLLISRIKVMARLDIAEKRVPQDGRLTLTLGGKGVDVRVSTLPSRFGERVVLRLLDNEKARLTLDQLGMSPATLASFRKALSQPNGIILVTGPTGAGKTTTLYAGLNLLNEATRNILTVEDPVEYALAGVGQTQVNPKVGMTFATGLRAILRQDPDVVMVGEIRDGETAGIAVQASLTGHLVLSTVHTNSAVAAITRLRDMGVESFLLGSTVTAIVAQRLVRRLCPHCRAPYAADAAEKAALGVAESDPLTLFRAPGCASCKGLGYQGRVGLYEIVTVDSTLRGMIHGDASEADMARHAFANSQTLFQHGADLVRAGTTSLAELLRVSREDGEGHAGL
ncbi:type II secretion system ATPase GspE [Hyphobacterium marinum]|uniref:Type II secretion system protein E n=1 Tax=Hyphobacterium marinum TaxID=3116574 RepID=A0ABU7LW15_9PROT|nr:type II secretion system ATPase GspE [Hyphobacterium sp. Y6023]MEE2565759.1 type II secretion system ATPase GspE [Hyphobacterium sp. Y6023]